MENLGIGERLRLAIKSKNKKLKEFSTEADIPYITLQQYLAEKRKPGTDALIKINMHLNISTDWLLTGKGEMYRTKTETKEIPTEKGITKWLSTWWKGADEEHRHWLNIQMKRQFPEYAEWCEQEEKKDKEN